MLPFWKLVGFSVYLALTAHGTGYFSVHAEQSLRTVGYIILPMVQCVFIVLSSNSDEPGYEFYRKNIFWGLTVSMCSDFCLVYQDELSRNLGAAFSAVALGLYLRAFGFKPFGNGATLASFMVIGVSVFMFLLPGLRGGDSLGAVLYLILLLTMAWRATVRYQFAPSLVNLLGSLGAIFFVISVYVLLRHLLISPWEYTHAVSMLSYYAAQLALALTATDDYTPTGYEMTPKKRA